MTVEHINPPELAPPLGYTHVVTARGGTTVHVSGQGAFDADQQLVGAGDHYEQAKQAFANVLHALRAAGAGFGDVVKATYLVVDLGPAALDAFARAMIEVVGLDAEPPAATMIGVAALALPGMLIEIEVTAVV